MDDPAALKSFTMRRFTLLLLLLAACDGSTGPRTRNITLHLCDDSQWIAWQNEGGSWTRLGEGSGVYVFAATERLAVARLQLPPGSSSSALFVDYLTADQVAPKLGCPQRSDLPGTIGGDVAGLTPFHWGYISFNGVLSHAPTGSTSWSLQAQPVPATLFAARFDSGNASVRANRMIIRRDRSYVAGTVVPLLDFESAEAFDPQVNTVSYTGGPSYVTVWYITRGRHHLLSAYPLGAFGEGELLRTAPMHSVPAGRLAPGDLHALLMAPDNRVGEFYVREGSDRSLALGAQLTTPTFSTVATVPYRIVRMNVPSQPDYPESISVDMYQFRSTRTTRIMLSATREYFGDTPAVWSLTIPEIGASAGFPMTAAFDDGEIHWNVTASNRRLGHGPATAQDGDRIISARVSGVIP